MSEWALAGVILAFVFAGMPLGLALQRVLPESHLAQDSKDVVKLGAGVIATLTALVLGMLVSTAKGSLDAKNADIMQVAVKILVVDSDLARYGPEAGAARELLRGGLAQLLATAAAEGPRAAAARGERAPTRLIEQFQQAVRGLAPQDDEQRALKAEIVSLARDVGAIRWTLVERDTNSIPTPFLVLVVLWLVAIYTLFGMIAPHNGTVWAVMFVSALSFVGTILVIIDTDRASGGLITVSTAPLVDALGRLGR